MIIADDLLVGPAAGDLLCPLLSDAADLAQSRRGLLDHVEDTDSERSDQARGVDRPDTLDHA
jgi:hypothetical protein